MFEVHVPITTPIASPLKTCLSKVELPRSPSGNFYPLPDPGGGLTSETAVRTKLTGTPTARSLFVTFLPSRLLKWGFRMFFSRKLSELSSVEPPGTKF
jgi:hypothetical protein